MNYCETCFEKVKEVDRHGDCKGCSTITEKESIQLTSPNIKNDEWIVVPSPFKAYPPSEGV